MRARRRDWFACTGFRTIANLAMSALSSIFTLRRRFPYASMGLTVRKEKDVSFAMWSQLKRGKRIVPTMREDSVGKVSPAPSSTTGRGSVRITSMDSVLLALNVIKCI
jgi:hypothetical protein